MKIGAGVAGIVLGIFSLLYVGFLGGMVGAGLGWLGSVGPQSDPNIIRSANVISVLSWLAPLLSIIGGIVTFSSPRVGGVLLAASAFSHWHLLGFGFIGKMFVLPIGATAALALFSSSSTPSATGSSAVAVTPTEPNSHAIVAGQTFDRAKWNALLQYDADIGEIAEKLRPLGQKWLDEFASGYLALNDKQYLPEIERKIVAAAKAEALEDEQRKLRAEEQRKASLLKQERLAQKRKEQQERLAEARKKQYALWRDRLWRYKAVVVGGILLSLVVGGGYWYYQKQETEKIIAAEKQRQEEMRAKAEAADALRREQFVTSCVERNSQRTDPPFPLSGTKAKMYCAEIEKRLAEIRHKILGSWQRRDENGRLESMVFSSDTVTRTRNGASKTTAFEIENSYGTIGQESLIMNNILYVVEFSGNTMKMSFGFIHGIPVVERWTRVGSQ